LKGESAQCTGVDYTACYVKTAQSDPYYEFLEDAPLYMNHPTATLAIECNNPEGEIMISRSYSTPQDEMGPHQTGFAPMTKVLTTKNANNLPVGVYLRSLESGQMQSNFFGHRIDAEITCCALHQ